MFVRLSSVRRDGKTYQYAQLVESVRRKAGAAPVHRVVANLGRVRDMSEIENLRAALQANRDGGRVAVVTAQAPPALSRPRAVLRYLDVAVVLRKLEQLGVLEVLNQLLPQGNSEVAPAQVVAALVAQRCLDPQSKLHAVRWFPRTALPELLSIAPEQFNNTRVHRTLEMLEQVEGDLMRALSRQIAQEQPLEVSFLDLTDTYFEGSGPELAERGKTKEGLIRKKVGIALLCSSTGLPLRWQVVLGNRAEPSTMLDMMHTVQSTPWLSSTPMVVDRAMGCTTYIRQMLETDVRFITAMRTMEHESYFSDLPARELLDLQPASKQDEERCAQQAAQRIERLGFKRATDTQFYRDAGIVSLPQPSKKKKVSSKNRQRPSCIAPSSAMQIARSVDEAVASGRFRTFAAAGRFFGYNIDQIKGFRRLRVLPEELQLRVLQGQVDSISRRQIARVGTLDEAQREEAFEQLARIHRGNQSSAEALRAAPPLPAPSTGKASVRCVAYFNPVIFAKQRRLAAQAVMEVEQYVEGLNEKLRDNPGRKPTTARQQIEQRLRRCDMISLFDIDVVQTGTSYLEVKLSLNEAEWQNRRRSDGFTVMVADSRIDMSAEQLCRTYRAKDTVETDFQVIKSLLGLRPVRHRTDLKVRAHVVLCMLALLVQRSIHWRLEKHHPSAQLALELLEPCRLLAHQISERSRPNYVLTQSTEQQARILRRLGLSQLVDEATLQQALSPRATFVTTERPKNA
jgi:transposase